VDGDAKPPSFAAKLSRAWRPEAFEYGPSVLALYRAWLVSLPISGISLMAAIAAIGLSFFLGRGVLPAAVIMDLAALCLVAPILRAALGLSIALPRGYWTSRNAPVRRREQPQRFWFLTAYAAAAAYLLLASVRMM
jgi:hypothetical protein